MCLNPLEATQYHKHRKMTGLIKAFGNAWQETHPVDSNFMNLDVQDYDLSVITHCNAFILIFLDWFHWIRMRSCGWWAGFPLSTAIVHITVTSVKLHLLLNEVNCFCVVWNDTFPQSFNVFCASKRFLYFISLKINSYAFLGYFIFLLLVFFKIMQKTRHIVFANVLWCWWKCYQSPFFYEHWGPTIL